MRIMKSLLTTTTFRSPLGPSRIRNHQVLRPSSIRSVPAVIKSASWSKGASLILVGNSSSDGVSIKTTSITLPPHHTSR